MVKKSTTSSIDTNLISVSERQLEDAIYFASKTQEGRGQLKERGLHFVKKKLDRQVNFGAYGIADLIQVEIRHDPSYGVGATVDIVELKKEKIDFKTFNQALKYAKAISKIGEVINAAWVKITIHLIGNDIDLQSNFVFLADLVNSEWFGVNLYTYTVDLTKGITFNQHANYCKSESNADVQSFMDLINREQNYFVQYQKQLLALHLEQYSGIDSPSKFLT